MTDLQCTGCGSTDVALLDTLTVAGEDVAVKGFCRTRESVYVEDL